MTEPQEEWKPERVQTSPTEGGVMAEKSVVEDNDCAEMNGERNNS